MTKENKEKISIRLFTNQFIVTQEQSVNSKPRRFTQEKSKNLLFLVKRAICRS